MTRQSCMVIAAAVMFASLGAASGTAYAYIDPGTGSYLFQLLMAGLFGAVVTAGVLWDRVKAFCRRCLHREERVREGHIGGR